MSDDATHDVANPQRNDAEIAALMPHGRRKAAASDAAAVLTFLESAWSVAADTVGWNRTELEAR